MSTLTLAHLANAASCGCVLSCGCVAEAVRAARAACDGVVVVAVVGVVLVVVGGVGVGVVLHRLHEARQCSHSLLPALRPGGGVCQIAEMRREQARAEAFARRDEAAVRSVQEMSFAGQPRSRQGSAGPSLHPPCEASRGATRVWLARMRELPRPSEG